MLRIFIFLICISLSVSSFAQKHLLSGHVFEEGSSKPISNVNISIVGKSAGATTNGQGYFELRVDRLPALLYFSHVGYAIDQVLVTRSRQRKIEIFLSAEVMEIDEVTISAEVIQKVNLGDTLNVIDYAIFGDRILLVASPFRRQSDKRLYLTDLQGKQLYNLPVSSMGKQIKIPEHMMPERVYIFQDFMGSFHVLTRQNVKQIDLSGDSIRLTYTTSYPKFLKYIFPIKAMLGESLFYQTSTKTTNNTFRTGPDAYRPVLVKTIKDPDGASRYITPSKHMYKNVSAPIVHQKKEVLIFDFFDDHIESFDSVGRSIEVIPIDFHSKTYTYFFALFSAKDLNQKEFKQEILSDEISGKIYALFHPFGQRVVLKEINPKNGQIIQEIEIPDYPNIDKIKVHNDIVYFTYHVKIYPYYTNIYRMKI